MGMKLSTIIILSVLVVLPLSLQGCVVDSAKKAVVGKLQEISAQGLNDAEWYVCKAAPIGTVIKRYGHSDERAREYKDFCSPNTEVNIVAP